MALDYKIGICNLHSQHKKRDKYFITLVTCQDVSPSSWICNRKKYCMDRMDIVKRMTYCGQAHDLLWPFTMFLPLALCDFLWESRPTLQGPLAPLHRYVCSLFACMCRSSRNCGMLRKPDPQRYGDKPNDLQISSWWIWWNLNQQKQPFNETPSLAPKRSGIWHPDVFSLHDWSQVWCPAVSALKKISWA